MPVISTQKTVGSRAMAFQQESLNGSRKDKVWLVIFPDLRKCSELHSVLLLLAG